MLQNSFALNNQTYANNNNILLGIMNELQQIINYSKEDLTIKRISDIIIKMNFFFNENKKYYQSIMNQFALQQNQLASVQNQLNQLNKNFKINNQQELKLKNGRYVGQVVNGLREGKGIMYYNDGSRYEGDFRNNIKEGKGIYYWNDGDRYEGDFRNDKAEGKGIYYSHNGDRYEGDFKNWKKEGKGIYYYSNGDREMGDYYNGEEIGKHVTLTSNGEVKINNNDFIKESEFN